MKKLLLGSLVLTMCLSTGAFILAQDIGVSVSPEITIGISLTDGIIALGDQPLGSTIDSIVDLADPQTIQNQSSFPLDLSIKSTSAIGDGGWTWNWNNVQAIDAGIQNAYLNSDSASTTANIQDTGAYFALGSLAGDATDAVGLIVGMPTATTIIDTNFSWTLTILAVLSTP